MKNEVIKTEFQDEQILNLEEMGEITGGRRDGGSEGDIWHN